MIAEFIQYYGTTGTAWMRMISESIQYFKFAKPMCKASLSMITEFLTIPGQGRRDVQGEPEHDHKIQRQYSDAANAMCKESLGMITEFT